MSFEGDLAVAMMRESHFKKYFFQLKNYNIFFSHRYCVALNFRLYGGSITTHLYFACQYRIEHQRLWLFVQRLYTVLTPGNRLHFSSFHHLQVYHYYQPVLPLKGQHVQLTLQSPFDTLIDAAFWVTSYLNNQKKAKKE